MSNIEHNKLAKKGINWIRSKSTGSGILRGTEVQLAPQYIADAVVLCWLQIRFQEMLDQKGQMQGTVCPEMIHIFEAKRTKPDFLSTFGHTNYYYKGNRWIPQGHFHYVITPRELVKPNEVPDFWGLLEERGSGLRLIKKPLLQAGIGKEKVYFIAYQILKYAKDYYFW